LLLSEAKKRNMTQTVLSNTARTRLAEIAASFQNALSSDYPEQVERAATAIGDAFEKGFKVLLFGNGGSAADAQHWAAEFVVRFQTERRALPAISLCADSSVLTACSNDYSFDQVFARQIEAFGQPGDIAIGLTTSGNSTNVIRGFQTARARGMVNILFTGRKKSAAVEHCDILLHAPSANTARIQELHLAAYHTICELIDYRFAK
jgi:D-sedoheptulose 7-phosphate isomerase